MTSVAQKLALALCLALAWLLAVPAARAEAVRTENVEAELHASRASVAPGESFTIVLRQKLRDGWHTYWRNAGDSGDPTNVDWTAPPGAVIGPLQFPVPKTIPVTPLMTYGFEGEILYPFEVTAPRNARPGQTLAFAAKVSSVVCSDICVIEDQALQLAVPVAAKGADHPVWAGRAAAALAAIPRPADAVAARITPEAAGARLTLTGGPFTGLAPKDAYFFPFDGLAISHPAAQTPTAGPDGLSFSLKPGGSKDLGQAPLAGVVRIDRAEGPPLAIEIRAEPGPALPGVSGAWAAPTTPATPSAAIPAEAVQLEVTGLAMAALFAFLGGLILNVMPCVFPVLSMKALSLAKTAHAGAARRQGVLFFAGVMTTFLALAGLLLALKGMGQQIGWGFQLQEPIIAGLLALVFFVIGLNLLGAFEWGAGLQNLGSGLAGRADDAGAFFTGALAVVAASPCTAPFMGGALGFASVASPLEALTVFAALGIGFALPFTALAFAPALLNRLPKPGPWMETFKQVMAFPMFATAIWLAWVVAVGAGANGALAVMAAALAVTFAIWASKAFSGALARSIAAGVAACVLAVAINLMLTAQPAQAAFTGAQAWSAARVQELRAEGKAVFVNFTAAWCISCKVNELNALDRDAVQQAFADKSVVYLKGDWTRRDPAIADELARYGRDGVPLYLYFPASGQGPPQVLPQLLDQDTVLRALQSQG
jgi:thiol:disulfide interchange protein DsbD